MSDLTKVRAEVKAWERTFKATTGRDPSVQDIKDNPTIADKYKLYKKLSKAAVAPAHSAIPKTRTLEPAAPLTSFNPFSPLRNKGPKPASSNPFQTPAKSKQSTRRSISPDLFPLIQPIKFDAEPVASTSSVANLAKDPTSRFPAPSTAVRRARKRLRGEPVSPSPNKEKRRKTVTQTTLHFPKLSQKSAISDDDEEDGDAAFMNDSPVKSMSSFKMLFEESHSPTKSGGLFRSSGPLNGIKLTSADNNPDSGDEDMLIPTDPPASSRASSEGPPSSKRSFPDSDTEMEDEEQEAEDLPPAVRLLPPSPIPGEGSKGSYGKSFRGGGKAAGAKSKGKGKEKEAPKKKARTSRDDESEEMQDTSEGEEGLGVSGVKSLAWNKTTTFEQQRGLDEGDDEGDEVDSILLPLQRPRLQHFTTSQPAPDISELSEVEENVEISLPPSMLRVLAISPVKSNVARDERVVRGILKGERFDARSAEVWGAGEGDDQDEVGDDLIKKAQRDEGEEEDWEGEGVPWEVGEL